MTNHLPTQEPRLPAPAPGSVRDLLQATEIRKRFQQVLGARAGQFIASLASIVYRSPGLRECDPMSVVAAALVAASLDLPIDPNLGYAGIVPYKGKAQFQMQWKGYVQLAHRTQQYAALHLTEIYNGQIKSVNPFTGAIEFGTRVSDEITGYLAYFRLINGFEKYLYMTKAEIDAHGKRYSKGFDNPRSLWQTNRQAMYRKTPIKLLLKTWGILSVDMQRAIAAEVPWDETVDADGQSPDNGRLTDDERKRDRAALWGESAEDANAQPATGPEWTWPLFDVGFASADGQGPDHTETVSAAPAAPSAALAVSSTNADAFAPSSEAPAPPTKPNGGKFKPAVLKGKIHARFEELCTEFANHYPAYRQANGIPDRMHILGALAAEGFTEVTAQNIEPGFEAIGRRAGRKAEAESERA